jgi:eukaryotic-like serine/threonine-protein kinase
MSLLAAGLWLVGSLLAHLIDRRGAPGITSWAQLGAPDAIATISVLLSIGMYMYTRRTTRAPQFVLDLGLGYMIVMAGALSMLLHWEPAIAGGTTRPMISWIGVVVVMFAAIVPNRPAKVLVASLIAVSMNPISMLIARARGAWDFGSPVHALGMHYPDYLLIGVAVVISAVLTRLGQQVTRARELGSYRIGELLGRGGMGEVYKATHRMLARPAAIKLIRPEVLAADDGQRSKLALTRFRREAEAAASLRSPHTVELYDFGVTEDGTFYFVMELLEGMDLETLVEEHGPLPPGRAIHILRQLCESLEEAHASGLVHRDIKPANIHVGRVGLRDDFVKVLDFGLVKAVAGKSTDHSMETATGLTPGTPAYMAPETALGEQVDARADIYAVGCVAYYLLTGTVVFEAENALQSIAKHLREQPVAPSVRAGITLPPALDDLVLACLAKAAKDRPPSAADLSNRLATIDVAPWTRDDAARWWAETRAPRPVPTLASPEAIALAPRA